MRSSSFTDFCKQFYQFLMIKQDDQELNIKVKKGKEF